jgi:hypothetical protein
MFGGVAIAQVDDVSKLLEGLPRLAADLRRLAEAEGDDPHRDRDEHDSPRPASANEGGQRPEEEQGAVLRELVALIEQVIAQQRLAEREVGGNGDEQRVDDSEDDAGRDDRGDLVTVGEVHDDRPTSEGAADHPSEGNGHHQDRDIEDPRQHAVVAGANGIGHQHAQHGHEEGGERAEEQERREDRRDPHAHLHLGGDFDGEGDPGRRQEDEGAEPNEIFWAGDDRATRHHGSGGENGSSNDREIPGLERG